MKKSERQVTFSQRISCLMKKNGPRKSGLQKIDDSFKKIVITKDIVQAYYDEYGILTVNIYDFLLDPNCLAK